MDFFLIMKFHFGDISSHKKKVVKYVLDIGGLNELIYN